MNLRQMQQDVVTRLSATPLVQAVASGKITHDQYRSYLIDVHAYARHSAAVIGYAASRLVISNRAAAQYLFHHGSEELGHEAWAASDLRDLGMSNADITASRPSSACLRMIGLEYLYALHDNPIGLFGWMFVLESLGGKIGGSVATALDRSLQLQGKATYFLAGHGEADSHHCEDLYRVISENVTSDEDRRAFLTMWHESDELYRGILGEVTIEATIPGAALGSVFAR